MPSRRDTCSTRSSSADALTWAIAPSMPSCTSACALLLLMPIRRPIVAYDMPARRSSSACSWCFSLRAFAALCAFVAPIVLLVLVVPDQVEQLAAARPRLLRRPRRTLARAALALALVVFRSPARRVGGADVARDALLDLDLRHHAPLRRRQLHRALPTSAEAAREVEDRRRRLGLRARSRLGIDHRVQREVEFVVAIADQRAQPEGEGELLGRLLNRCRPHAARPLRP